MWLEKIVLVLFGFVVFCNFASIKNEDNNVMKCRDFCNKEFRKFVLINKALPAFSAPFISNLLQTYNMTLVGYVLDGLIMAKSYNSRFDSAECEEKCEDKVDTLFLDDLNLILHKAGDLYSKTVILQHQALNENFSIHNQWKSVLFVKTINHIRFLSNCYFEMISAKADEKKSLREKYLEIATDSDDNPNGLYALSHKLKQVLTGKTVLGNMFSEPDESILKLDNNLCKPENLKTLLRLITSLIIQILDVYQNEFMTDFQEVELTIYNICHKDLLSREDL